jgi:hypothetical protein
MRAWRLAIVGIVLGTVGADAALLCTAKNGTVKLRESACRKKESRLDPVAAGLQGPPGPTGAKGVDGAPNTTTLAGYVEVPNFNMGTRDVLDVPGFGRFVIQDGGCTALPGAEVAAPAWVNSTGTDQDVFTFLVSPNSGTPLDPHYLVAMPGAETGFDLAFGPSTYLTFRVRQRTSAAQATIDVFLATGGAAGSVCKVTAHAVVTSG